MTTRDFMYWVGVIFGLIGIGFSYLEHHTIVAFALAGSIGVWTYLKKRYSGKFPLSALFMASFGIVLIPFEGRGLGRNLPPPIPISSNAVDFIMWSAVIVGVIGYLFAVVESGFDERRLSACKKGALGIIAFGILSGVFGLVD